MASTVNRRRFRREGTTTQLAASQHARQLMYDTTIDSMKYIKNDNTTERRLLTTDNSDKVLRAFGCTGAINSDAAITGATGIIATAGGVTATAGDIKASAGNIIGKKLQLFNYSSLNNADGQILTADFYGQTIISSNTYSLIRIDTTNETGDADGGAYAIWIRALIVHGSNAADSAAVATSDYVSGKSYMGHFVNVQKKDGTSAQSAITQISLSDAAATDAANRSIGTVVMTVSKSTDYLNTIDFQIQLTGTDQTSAWVSMEVTMKAFGYTTMPVMAAVV